MKLSALLFSAATLVAVNGTADAQDKEGERRSTPKVNVTSTTSFNWHTDNDDELDGNDNYGEMFERLNLSTTDGAWNVGLRIDASGYASTPTDTMNDAELEDRYESDVLLEKFNFGWTSRTVDARAGDSYVSFGRGMALSLRKVDELGVDTTLRGAKVLWHEGARSGTLIAGVTNTNNVDESSGRTMEDPMDIVAGAQGQVRVAKRYDVGAHAAVVAFREPLGFVGPDDEIERYADRWVMAGTSIAAPRATDHFGFYAETLAQRREDSTGYGLYGSATYHKGKSTWLFEAKAYGDLKVVRPEIELTEFSSVQYSSPPTVERVLQPLDHEQRDTFGGRVRYDWSRTPNLRLFANLGLFRDYNGFSTLIEEGMPPVLVDATISDPWVGAEVRWDDARSRARLTTGWRTVVADVTQERVRGDKHVELDLAHALKPRLALEVHLIHLERYHYVPPFLEEDHREGTLQLGLRWSPTLAIGGVYDYTTQQLQPKVHYFSAAAEWRPSSTVALRVRAGATRGGLKCVSGICREFPPFEGIKLSSTIRY